MAQKVLLNGVDVTASIAAGSLVIKQNTADFTLVDAGVTNIGSLPMSQAVTIKDPNWSGTVTIARQYDIVDLRSGHYKCDITATNTAVGGSTVAPFSLSDQPVAVAPTYWTLEDGSGVYELEDGSAWAPGNYEMEDASTYGYSGLEQGASIGGVSGTTTYIRCIIYQPGLAVGMQLNITSGNFAPSLGSPLLMFNITNIITTWPTGVDGTAQFELESGSSLVTFNNYKQL